MADLNSKLGPGALKDPTKSLYAISRSDWEKVNEYVRKIVEIPPKVATHMILLLPVFPELQACAFKWQTTTFPNLLRLSRSIYEYGTVEVVNAYTGLKDMLRLIDESADPQPYHAPFHQSMSGLLGHANARTELAISIATEATQFVRIIEQAARHFKQTMKSRSMPVMPGGFDPYAEAAEIGQVLSQLPGVVHGLQQAPLGFIQFMQGSWLAIRDDLKSILDTYQYEFVFESPFLTDIGIDHALDEWKFVANEAHAFSASAW